MRTSDDISRFLRDLERIWLSHQELRFCQLLENAIGREEDGSHKCMFYIEDDQVIEKIKNAIQKTPEKTKR